jgi:hypothetical protein
MLHAFGGPFFRYFVEFFAFRTVLATMAGPVAVATMMADASSTTPAHAPFRACDCGIGFAICIIENSAR